MTRAQRHGLEAVALNNGSARRSNFTNKHVGSVYWRTADWLLDQGLIRWVNNRTYGSLELTGAGIAAMSEEASP